MLTLKIHGVSEGGSPIHSFLPCCGFAIFHMSLQGYSGIIKVALRKKRGNTRGRHTSLNCFDWALKCLFSHFIHQNWSCDSISKWKAVGKYLGTQKEKMYSVNIYLILRLFGFLFARHDFGLVLNEKDGMRQVSLLKDLPVYVFKNVSFQTKKFSDLSSEVVTNPITQMRCKSEI